MKKEELERKRQKLEKMLNKAGPGKSFAGKSFPGKSFPVDDSVKIEVTTDLKGVDFSKCRFKNIEFRGNLEGCNFKGASFYRCKFIDGKYKDCNYEDISSRDVRFSGCVLDHCNFKFAAHLYSFFDKNSMYGCCFSYNKMYNPRFRENVLDSCNFKNCYFKDIEDIHTLKKNFIHDCSFDESVVEFKFSEEKQIFMEGLAKLGKQNPEFECSWLKDIVKSNTVYFEKMKVEHLDEATLKMKGQEEAKPSLENAEQRGTGSASSPMTMEERYTKALGLMGYKLTDTPIDSMATVTFIRGSDGQDAIRSDGWEGVGYVLEERLPGLKGKLASEIKALLYPQGNPEDALCAPEPEAPPKDSFMKREMMEERMMSMQM